MNEYARPRALQPALIDPFGRHVSYLRVSVTDRCDFRCTYCMSEHMTFLPKRDLLTLEELDRLCSAFVAKGVRKLRITGGEPLVRKNILWLFRALSRHLGSGALDDLTLTTNGSQLPKFAAELKDAGVRRINISLDTLRPDRFKAITRWGDFDVRYLWMRQKQIIGSHFANAYECNKANELIESGQIRPVLWRTLGFEGVPEAHQLMLENKHLGKISILVGADEDGQGKTADGPGAIRAEVGA